MSLMKDRYFIDTNVIVYLFDKSDIRKNERARKLVKEALESGNGVVSFQVIQEFCNVALRKFFTPLSPGDCKTFVNRYLYPLCSIFPGIELYNAALDIKETTGYGFYDSIILASACHSGCKIIYTEDMKDGQNVNGIKIINPFSIT